jgi:hypothetical protein
MRCIELFWGILMSSGKHTFKHTDATRLIRATIAAGLKVRHVMLQDGAIRVEFDDGSAAPAEPNDWAGVLEDAEERSA